MVGSSRYITTTGVSAKWSVSTASIPLDADPDDVAHQPVVERRPGVDHRLHRPVADRRHRDHCQHVDEGAGIEEQGEQG
jgi:hypothetical protein